VRRTTAADLALPFLFFGLLAFVLLRVSYSSLPPLRNYVPLPLVTLAAAELVAARRVRAAVRHDRNAKPMAAIVIARCVALGKASSLVGAGVAGGALGLLVRLVPDASRITAAQHDSWVGVAILIASLLLTGAGLLLERAGVDPGAER